MNASNGPGIGNTGTSKTNKDKFLPYDSYVLLGKRKKTGMWRKEGSLGARDSLGCGGLGVLPQAGKEPPLWLS